MSGWLTKLHFLHCFPLETWGEFVFCVGVGWVPCLGSHVLVPIHTQVHNLTVFMVSLTLFDCLDLYIVQVIEHGGWKGRKKATLAVKTLSRCTILCNGRFSIALRLRIHPSISYVTHPRTWMGAQSAGAFFPNSHQHLSPWLLDILTAWPHWLHLLSFSTLICQGNFFSLLFTSISYRFSLKLFTKREPEKFLLAIIKILEQFPRERIKGWTYQGEI